MKIDCLVIGGGSAGMSAALKAHAQGISVLIVEREDRLGGILKQCIHNGFGLKYFKKEMTGPEYANALIEKVKRTDIKVLLETMVNGISRKEDGNYVVSVLSKNGAFNITAKAIILAMGCRERPAAAIGLCGTRPVGVLTAGAAQKIINIDGQMIGKKVVIIGSGDVGLIMARRLFCEGAKVEGVYEIASTPSGLNRNIVQCLNDYNIPLHLGETAVEVLGKDRVEGVVVAKVNPDFSFDMSTKRTIKCDTILLSVGLVPENDLVSGLIKINNTTSGAIVDDHYMTSEQGIFSCGNVLHVHDIVDDVTLEAETAGEMAGLYVCGKLEKTKEYNTIAGNGVRYLVPSFVSGGNGFVTLKFRVSKAVKNPKIVVSCNGAVIADRNAKIVLPAQMEQVMVDRSKIKGDIMVEVIG